jgi:predicted nucleic acid-binding protein
VTVTKYARIRRRCHEQRKRNSNSRPSGHEPRAEYGRILGDLVTTYQLGDNLIPDAALAALAIEHGVTLISTDTDFSRFRGPQWENPLQP